MRRTDLMDVSPEMHRRIVEILRAKTWQWKFQKTLAMTQELREFVKAARRATGR